MADCVCHGGQWKILPRTQSDQKIAHKTGRDVPGVHAPKWQKCSLPHDLALLHEVVGDLGLRGVIKDHGGWQAETSLALQLVSELHA